jgi:AAA ATPase domain/Helix-turn-helix domain/WD domain, G-beta repeat
MTDCRKGELGVPDTLPIEELIARSSIGGEMDPELDGVCSDNEATDFFARQHDAPIDPESPADDGSGERRPRHRLDTPPRKAVRHGFGPAHRPIFIMPPGVERRDAHASTVRVLDQNCDRRPDPVRISTRQDFAHALTALRESAGLSIRQVAKRADIPFRTFGDYCTGRHLPQVTQPDVFPKILAACGVSDAGTVREWNEALRRVRDMRPVGMPYRGLEAFEPEDAAWFFGRERLTAELVEQLIGRHQRGGLLVVIGVSGSGKSSLLRAGLIPALRRGDLDARGLENSKNWPWLLCTPGEHPMKELATRLAAKVQAAPADVEGILRSDPRTAADLARQACMGSDLGDPTSEPGDAGPGPDSRLVVVVDQFEEVFTSCSDEAERTAFIAALRAAAAGRPVEPTDTDSGRRYPPAALVLLGLRADFYSVVLRRADLLPALQSPVVVGPMTEDELRDVIVKPAKKAQGDLEDGLVELLLRDLRPAAGSGTHEGQNNGDESPLPAAYEAGALPLLSHALDVTWRRLHRGRMTVADYLAAGAIQGAVTQTAEKAFNKLTPQQQKTARQLFLRLVHAAHDRADTRRRVSPAELLDNNGHTQSEELAAVLDQFVNRRLIIVDRDHVEIAHDSLLSAWPRLRNWIDADRAGLVIFRRLTEDAQAWDAARRDTGRLYRGGQLAIAAQWAGSASMALPQVARDFLDASLAARRRLAHLRTAAAVVLMVLLAFTATAALVAYHQRQDALHLQRIATADVLVRDADLARYRDPDLALDLALAAHRLDPTADARASLVTTITREHGFVPLDRPGSDTFYTVAYSPDGRTLATGSFDETVKLWDLTQPTPTRLATLDAHSDSVVALVFSLDGRTLVSGSDDQTAIVWDVTDRAHPTRLAILTGHTRPVLAAAFRPDGRTLATSSGDGTVTLWNTADRAHPTRLAALSIAAVGIRTVTFSPDGHTMVTGDFDGKTILWNVTDPAHPTQQASPLTSHKGTVFTANFSSDGRTLATGSVDQSVILWNVTDPTHPYEASRLTDHTGPVVTAAFSLRTPDTGGTRHILATGSFDRTVALWDVTNPEHPSLLATVAGHTDPVRSVAFSPDGRAFATGGSDRRVLMWNVGELLELADHAVERACETVGDEGLDRREWATYVRNIDYEPSCP